MNKIILNKIAFLLAGFVAAVTFTSEASALPLFARQTGMECAACHFQHFPMLTAFGRSFKNGAYSMVGAQEKVEGDNLSIPAVLNAAILSTAGYSKSNIAPSGTASTNGIQSNGEGGFYMPGSNGEFSLFVGGRTSDFSGALAELAMVPDGTGQGGAPGGVSSAKIPMLWEVADGTRAGIVPFTTDGQGASYGFETLNTGANAVHTMLFVGGDFQGMVAPALSAQQYIGTGAIATGIAGVVNNESYFVNITKFSQTGPGDVGGTTVKLGSTYARAAYIFDLSGWDSAVGVQSWSGSSGNGDPATTALVDTKATAIDGQMQGAVNGMPVGFYASYANAPAPSAGGPDNAFNSAGAASRSSLNFSTEWGVIPEKATLNFAIRRGKSGQAYNGSSNATDNAILVGASYKLRQNIMVNLYYVSQSGDWWDQAHQDSLGSKLTAINLATIF
ncbi:MAG: hypothetical protein WCA64_02450 [Gallionella sp.]